MALRCFDNMSKETEVITKGKQGILMDLDFTLRMEICKYPSVLSQQSVNISDKII